MGHAGFYIDCHRMTVPENILLQKALPTDLSRCINYFQQLCYRRMMKIKWTDKISNEEVLQRIREKELWLYNSVKKQ